MAAKIYSALHVRQLPAVLGWRLVGIVSEWDIMDLRELVGDSLTRGGRSAGSAHELSVESVTTPRVLTVEAEDSSLQAASVMRRLRVTALVVLHDGRAAGIFTRSDWIDAFVSFLASGNEASRSQGVSLEEGLE